jgi:ubiquitin-protein ligase
MSRNKRILREIENALVSDEFEFFDDTEGMFGEKNACYIRFWINQGAFERQVHILEVRFIWGSNVVYKYPKKPLMIRFVTPLFHTNISREGSICLDVIKDSKWSPMYGIETVFNSIVALIEDPNHSSPFNGTASSACKNNTPEVYREMTMEYYVKQMTADAYKRAIPILQFGGFTTGIKGEELEKRSSYLRSLFVSLGLEAPADEEAPEVDTSTSKGKEEDVPVEDDIPTDSSDE